MAFFLAFSWHFLTMIDAWLSSIWRFRKPTGGSAFSLRAITLSRLRRTSQVSFSPMKYRRTAGPMAKSWSREMPTRNGILIAFGNSGGGLRAGCSRGASSASQKAYILFRIERFTEVSARILISSISFPSAS